MLNRKLLLLIGVVALLFFIVLTVLLGTSKKPPAPINAVTPTVTPVVDEEELDGEEAVEEAVAKHGHQPIVRALPYATYYWYAEYRGSTHGIYHVLAVVFYTEGQDPAAKIREQKPFILDYLRKTGQPAGTYDVTYRSRMVQAE